MRGEIRKLATPSWLDGAVAGAGAAAACAAFAFHRVLIVAGGSAITVVTNLAYPVADLLLLALLVGGSTLIAGRHKAPWILMAAGIAINVVGDTANLFNSSLVASVLFSTRSPGRRRSCFCRCACGPARTDRPPGCAEAEHLRHPGSERGLRPARPAGRNAAHDEPGGVGLATATLVLVGSG